jgi:hypothetical protein
VSQQENGQQLDRCLGQLQEKCLGDTMCTNPISGLGIRIRCKEQDRIDNSHVGCSLLSHYDAFLRLGRRCDGCGNICKVEKRQKMIIYQFATRSSCVKYFHL